MPGRKDRTGHSVNAADAIGGVLARLKRGWQRRSRVAEAWREAVGAETYEATALVSLRAGVLHVEVSSAALRHELSYLERGILDVLRRRGAGVEELRFTLRQAEEDGKGPRDDAAGRNWESTDGEG